MKLVAVLRNPVERASSQFEFYRQKGLEARSSLVEACSAEPIWEPLVYDLSYQSTSCRSQGRCSGWVGLLENEGA